MTREVKSAEPDAANPKEQTTIEPGEQQIRERAYQFFVHRGYKHGHDKEDWLRAEKELRAHLVRDSHLRNRH